MEIGFSGPFPPHPSGGAALSYWLLAELVKKPGVNVYGYSTTGRPIYPKGVMNPVDPVGLNAMLFYYSNIVQHAVPLLKGRVLLVAHHGFDNVMGTAKELAESLTGADVIIATDKWEKGIFESAGLKNVVIVPYPIDTSLYVPKAKQKPVEILYTGRLLTYKGIIQVLQAMDYILTREDVRFRIHGYIDLHWDGYIEIAQALESLAEKHGPKVIVEEMWTMPWDMPKIYDGAHIFLFPSGRASFGIPLAEAMSCEIPVVTTSYGSHAEVVRGAGILLPPEVEVEVKHVYAKRSWTNLVPSTKSIIDATLELIHDDQLREDLGKRGREKVKQQFDSPLVINRLMEVINENFDRACHR
jgi:glycosyltransferase involved in cell wall biosynthesis